MKTEFRITEETIKKLKASLPMEAVSQHPTKPYLSTIKAIYVVERLNEVFGLGGWKVENEVIVGHPSKMIVVKSKFTALDIYVEAFGGNDNPDLGDAYKGACTDALTKIGSYLYVGMDVFKGLVKGHIDTRLSGSVTQNPAPSSTKSTQEVESPLCACGKPAKRVQTKKAGRNKDRWFFSCPQPQGSQCNPSFLGWEDELSGSETFDDKFRRDPRIDYDAEGKEYQKGIDELDKLNAENRGVDFGTY